mgnify:FL=1
MKTIKFYPSDRSLMRLDGKLLKGYTIDSIPDNINSWFNYKGLTYVTSWQTTDERLGLGLEETESAHTLNSMGFSWYEM